MYETRMVRVGNLTLGGHNPVWVQSMTNTDTRDAQATLGQIRALAKAGCDIVRVSVYDEDCARAVRTLVDGSPVQPVRKKMMAPVKQVGPPCHCRGGKRHPQAAHQSRQYRRRSARSGTGGGGKGAPHPDSHRREHRVD